MANAPAADNKDPGQNAAEQKLTAARTRLILDNPFLGVLVLRMPLVNATDWCETSGTDAKNIFYNQTYINNLTLSQVQFVLAHEALHCGLSHFARREQRTRRRWDVACDHAVNQLLVNEDLEQPQGTLLNAEYSGLSAEEIYLCIDSETNEQPMDQHYYDAEPDEPQQIDTSTTDNDSSNVAADTQSEPSGQTAEPPGQTQNPPPDQSPDNQDTSDDLSQHKQSSHPQPLSNAEQDRLDTQWQQRLASAAQQAAQTGKLSESMSRTLERLLQPVLPWRALLARFMSSTARTDYNLTRPSRRREGDAILPSLHTRQIDVAVALDTSGSVKENELNEFLTELDAIKGTMNARITLFACDDNLDRDCPWIYEPWDTMQLPAKLGGGGLTDFRPVFDYLSGIAVQPDLLIYFTDARGRFPQDRPGAPVLWLVKGSASVPWGQRIQLN